MKDCHVNDVSLEDVREGLEIHGSDVVTCGPGSGGGRSIHISATSDSLAELARSLTV